MVLSVPPWRLLDEQLRALPHSDFYEPDLGDQLTALAVLPDEEATRFLRRFPLLAEGR